MVDALDVSSFDAFVTLRRELAANLLLWKAFVALHAGGLAGEVLGLPGWSADVLDAVWVLEHRVDLLKGFSGGFREHEEDVDGHSDTEDSEDDVSTPGDVDEGRRNEVAESEVEGPVTRCS